MLRARDYDAALCAIHSAQLSYTGITPNMNAMTTKHYFVVVGTQNDDGTFTFHSDDSTADARFSDGLIWDEGEEMWRRPRLDEAERDKAMSDALATRLA